MSQIVFSEFIGHQSGLWQCIVGGSVPIRVVGSTRLFNRLVNVPLDKPGLKSFLDPNWRAIKETHDYTRKLLDMSYWPGLPLNQVIKSSLVHGDTVAHIDGDFLDKLDVHQKFEALQKTDALITGEENCVLMMRGADCPPVIIIDMEHAVFGVCHSGWRGTAKCISLKMLVKMTETFGTNPKQAFVIIGPSVHSNIFEFTEEIQKGFSENYSVREINRCTDWHPTSFEIKKDMTGLNLVNAITDKLHHVGRVPRSKIFASKYSTHWRNGKTFFFNSAERSGGIENTDSNVFLVGKIDY